LTAEKMLAIWARCRYGFFRKARNIGFRMAPWGTPRRLAGRRLFAPRRCRRCWWWASEANAASASTTPRGAPGAATSCNPGRARASHPGPGRARGANKICCCTSTIIRHCHQGRRGLAPCAGCSQRRRKKVRTEVSESPGPSLAAETGPPPASPPPKHGFLPSASDGVVLPPPQKTVQRGVVGHRLQVPYDAQLVLLSQAYLGFAKGSVFLAHQAQHRQQLRLGERRVR